MIGLGHGTRNKDGGVKAMDDNERLRAVEVSAIRSHDRMDSHEKLCSILGKQTQQSFVEIKSGMKRINQLLITLLLSLLAAAGSFHLDKLP